MKTVQCDDHGVQPETFVCQHIVSGLLKRRRVGFYWTSSDRDNPRPDAWCAACEERVRAAGGEWIGEAAQHLHASLMCGACYDAAKSFHLGGNPWS